MLALPGDGLNLRSLLLCSRSSMLALCDVLSVSPGDGLGRLDDTLPLRGLALGLQDVVTILPPLGRVGMRARRAEAAGD